MRCLARTLDAHRLVPFLCMLAEPREHIRINGLLAGFIQDLMAHAWIEDERNIFHACVAIQLDRANDRFAVLTHRIFGARDEQ